MASTLHARLHVSLLVVAGAVLACETGPVDTSDGELGQPCFPGNTCDEGFVCLPFTFDGGITDGGECFLAEVDAGDADAPASDGAAAKDGD
jgi:hypothetical protein